MSLNAMLRDLDIVSLQTDGRLVEVVAEGLTLFGVCQLALDATVVSPLHGDGTHRRRENAEDGVALREARKRKEKTYTELCQGNGRARLVVIREKLEASGSKKPRRSCGRWLAPTPHLCRDGCTAVPELLDTGGGRASWPVLRRRQWLTPFWTRRVIFKKSGFSLYDILAFFGPIL